MHWNHLKDFKTNCWTPNTKFLMGNSRVRLQICSFDMFPGDSDAVGNESWWQQFLCYEEASFCHTHIFEMCSKHVFFYPPPFLSLLPYILDTSTMQVTQYWYGSTDHNHARIDVLAPSLLIKVFVWVIFFTLKLEKCKTFCLAYESESTNCRSSWYPFPHEVMHKV
jgi:hypothetical protein